MKTFATLSFGLALAASAHPTVSTRADEQDYNATYLGQILLDRLEKIAISEESPPRFVSPQAWQHTCPDVLLSFQGEQVQFWHEASIYPNDTISKRAFYIPHVETGDINPGPGDLKLSIAKSTMNSKMESKGWTVGARVAGTFGAKDGPSANVELSASYSDTTTTTKMQTVTTSHDASCKPGYECRLETWTFHIAVRARTRLLPYYQTWTAAGGHGAKTETCQMKQSVATCEQFRQRLREWCDYSPEVNNYAVAWNTWHKGVWPPAPLDRTEDIELKLPIAEANGNQLMSRVVLVSEPIMRKKSGDVPAAVKEGTQQTIKEAMERGTKFQVLDSSSSSS
ncbi:hypothetical protein MGU_07306 [Metarhizium guizhouense ARSEF 977]|uniref:Uncharacterized protein n=1 Tax=Metarhizium guizhouense (strain ARSEF 977) TaxID=1276136 RepID=A0A0B4HZX3_METGA|nr:hypothetical protein MGU_07306 [Metarhizium guizhouense ARSEF 977]